METNIALFVFNRPDLTRYTFDQIRQIRPRNLFLVADGPRFESEIEVVEAVRKDIEERIDWDCEVFRNYSDMNLGCKVRVSSGLDWVFDQVEDCIILEDDCVPHPDFFSFCQELLIRYRDNDQVMMISGQSFLKRKNTVSESYYFSKHVLIWGWATWRRAWKLNQLQMQTWPGVRNTPWLENLLNDPHTAQSWEKVFEKTYQGQIDTWDHQWRYSIWYEGGLVIVPYQNMISNMGFGPSATHTKKTSVKLANYPVSSLSFPLQHPSLIKWNRENDRLMQERILFLSKPRPNLLLRLRDKLFS